MRRPDNPTPPTAPAVALSAALALVLAFAFPPESRGGDAATEAMRREVAVKKAQDELILHRIKVLPPGDPPALAVPPAAPFPPAVVLPRGVAAQRNVAQIIPLFAQQFRPTLRAEYQLLVRVCDPTKDQRREIAREGERALTLAATKLADWQRVPTPVPVRAGAPGSPDPLAIIQDALAAAARKHLPAAKVARYLKEVDGRTADRRRVTVQGVVARFDQVLLLSPDQREALTELLTTNWDDAWCPSPQYVMVNVSNLPQIPDRYVVPVLSPAQNRVWAGTPKTQPYALAGVVAMDGTDNIPLEDAELGDAIKPPPIPGEVE